MENEEMKEPKEKILRQETFKVDCPKQITIGDPSYFEEFSGKKLDKLTVNCKPYKRFAYRKFETRVTVTEITFEEFPDAKMCNLSIYMAPEKTIKTYMENKMYEGQEAFDKEIGVDTARYLMIIDDKSDVIYTGGDGYWGCYGEYSRKIEGKRYVDAIIIHLSMPEFDSYETVKQRMRYFFNNVQPIE